MNLTPVITNRSVFNCLSIVLLPCPGNISRDSFRLIFSKEKKLLKTKLRVFRILALLAFFLGSEIFGAFEIYAQKTTAPDISASVSGALTCTNTSVKLKGNSKTLGAYYAWSGPGGFYTTAQNPVTAIPGDYTLTVKDPVNGGTATALVKVLTDTITPAGIKATVSGLLTCKDTIITLTASSVTPGVAYHWKGPENYASDLKNPVASVPGIYLVKVINPVNGCSGTAKVAAEQNILPPSGVSATVSGVLNCKITSVTVTGTSVTKDVNYAWSGQGFASAATKAEVTAPGTYHLVVTDPANGCVTKDQVQVEQNIAVPDAVTAEVLDSITCRNARVTLKASSATKEAIYSWTGPKDFRSGEPITKTGLSGQFTVTVTNPENGCFLRKTVTVVTDTMKPAADVIASGSLTCIAKTVTLKGSSSLPKISYSWKGPESFTSQVSSPQVSLPGNYEVVVTNPANGCSVRKSIQVDQHNAAPEKVSASVSGYLSCENPNVKLNGSSATEGVTYSWSGPQGFMSNEKSPETKIPGNYSLMVTSQLTGCTSKTNVMVTGNACNK